MADTDRRFAVPSELGVAALVVAASLPLGRLFRTGSIFPTTFAAAAVSTAVAWALRRLRAPTIVSAVAALAAFVWFASIQFSRDAMIGPFPTPDSVTNIWHLMTEAVRRSQVDAAPVTTSAAFLALCSFAVWATAWLADDAAIKLRHPMLAIGVTVPLYVLPGTIVEGTNRWADAGLYLAAALWVLFQDERFRLSRWGRVIGTGVPGWRPGLAARMGLVAIALALVATPVLPGFGAPPGLRGVSGGSGDRRVENPLVTIKDRLSSPRVVSVFAVRTRFASYMRLTALDLFNGIQWNASPQSPSLAVSGRTIATSTAATTTRVQQDVEILALGGAWLPAAYEPVRVDRLRGVGADPATRALIAPRDIGRGLEYRVTSRVPQLSYDALDQVPFASDPSLQRYVALPPGAQTEQVRAIARRVIGTAKADAAGPFRMAVALQNYLRTFTYDEQVGLNHSIDDVVDFLENDKRGYCEQFATAMSVMARSLGIPARVAIGFAGGTPGATPDEIVVTSRNAHAWVEIYLQGYGWVPFEPTPRGDSVVVPSYTSRTAFPEPQAPTAEPTETTEPTPTASSTGREGIDPEIGNDRPSAVRKSLVIAGLVIGGLLLLGAVAFPIAAVARRAARGRRAHSNQERVAVRYLDFLDWCASTGVGRSSGETPLEHASRLSSGSAAARELATMAVGAVYGPPNGVDPAAVSRLGKRARAEVGSTLPARTRVGVKLGWGWWRLDPASRSRFRQTDAERPVRN